MTSPGGHVWAVCTDKHCIGCCLCHGGLSSCTVCDGHEGSLPTDCPGTPMSESLSEDVYGGKTDYVLEKGGWVDTPSKHSPAAYKTESRK